MKRAARKASPSARSHAGYYVASSETRLTYATAYIGLLVFLAVMTHKVHEMLRAARQVG